MINKMKFTKLSVMLVLLSSIMTVFTGCKNDNKSEDIVVPLLEKPSYIAPTQPGILQISQNSLVLHLTNTATISAEIYNSDGTLQPSQPAFIWSVDNTSIASVSGGIITANSIGNATVSVTDGSHGIEFVNVNVVDDTTVIPTNQYFISFSPPLLTMQKGATGSFSYTVKTADGKTAGITPTFSTLTSSGITITGNSVHAGDKTDLFNINSVYGQDTLKGFLQVLVSNPSSSTADTTWKISKLIRFPTWFTNNGLVSLPVRIEVTEIIHRTDKPDSIVKFQTSPDQIGIDYPSVITMNSNGNMTSVAPGLTSGIIKYKSTQTYFFSGVRFHYEGSNWSNSTLSLCFPEIENNIWYFNIDYLGHIVPQCLCLLSGCNNDQPKLVHATPWFEWGVRGSYLADGTMVFNGGPGYRGPRSTNSVVFSQSRIDFVDCDKVIKDGVYVDDDHIKFTTSFGDQILTRGTGDCGDIVPGPTNISYATWHYGSVLCSAKVDSSLVDVLYEGDCPTATTFEFETLTGEYIYLIVPISGIGTYSLTDDTPDSCPLEGGYGDTESEYTMTTGTLTITESNSNYIAGTFNISGDPLDNSGPPGLLITQGSFKVYTP
jgi:hypothetical protein